MMSLSPFIRHSTGSLWGEWQHPWNMRTGYGPGYTSPSTSPYLRMSPTLNFGGQYFNRSPYTQMSGWQHPWGHSNHHFQVSPVVPGLYLSDAYTAMNPEALRQLGITHVLSVMRNPLCRYTNGIQHLCIPISDLGHEDLAGYLDTAVHWIRSALQTRTIANGVFIEGRVLVHCKQGMSRSASIVLAYLIAEYGMSLEYAVPFLQARRAVINPNPGFLLQLKHFENKVKHTQYYRGMGSRSALFGTAFGSGYSSANWC